MTAVSPAHLSPVTSGITLPASLFSGKIHNLLRGTMSITLGLMKAVHWLLGSWFHLPPFILKRNLCPYYLTSSSVAVNYIKAHFPKLRNFRIYFVACCYRESLLGIRAPACWGREWVQPHCQHHSNCYQMETSSADTGSPVLCLCPICRGQRDVIQTQHCKAL